MRLEDEIKSISLLSDNELRRRLSEIRNNRLQPPEKVKQRERKKTKDTNSAIERLLAGLNPDQIQEILTGIKND